MEKVGLIASAFTPRVKDICDEIERLSDGQYRIGYCYSLEGVKVGESHPDTKWAATHRSEMPDRLQEVMRNCDLFLTLQADTPDVSTLPLMTAKGTFILTEASASSKQLSDLAATAEEYGTKMNYGSLSDSDIAEKIVRFYPLSAYFSLYIGKGNNFTADNTTLPSDLTSTSSVDFTLYVTSAS